jgi:hypothetical protein
MNEQTIEHFGAAVWLAVVVVLRMLAIYSNRLPRREIQTVRAILWAAFLCFAFLPIPIGGFDLMVIPAGCYVCIGVVGAFVVQALPGHPSITHVPLWVAYVAIASLLTLVIVALITFRPLRSTTRVVG